MAHEREMSGSDNAAAIRTRGLSKAFGRTPVLRGLDLEVPWGRVLTVLGGTNLVSLPWFPMAVAQSVIPIGAVLFIAAQLLSLPQALEGPMPRDHEQGPQDDEQGPRDDEPEEPT